MSASDGCEQARNSDPFRRRSLTPSLMQICLAEQDDHALLMGLLLRADGGVKCLAETQ